jgi:NADH-quinone oxidoreductase subunit L
MNRLGDLGFLTGIMIVFTQFRTLNITELFDKGGLVLSAVVQNGLWLNGANQMPAVWLTIAGLAFFFGATAKSAQFPLHTWLPDAMEGPTSVSSLIHAATMVAAGVFLLGRIYPLFDNTVLMVIATIGAFTAFMAATIALTQNDIKRILAFSTISQLGFMMIAMGVGAYSASIFHLATHAFFKCLLFLAAGAVIHEMAHLKTKSGLDFDHQDIQNMGGLKKLMPLTFITMTLASLALSGIPFTSGFLSKDAILIQAFEWSDGQSIWVKLIPYSAFLTSGLTAFYIARLLFKVFFGNFRLKNLASNIHLHEAPNVMKYVLLVLAVFCLFLPFSLSPFHYDSAWIFQGLASAPEKVQNSYHVIIPVTVSIMAVILILVAYTWYGKRLTGPDLSKNSVFRFAQKQWYFNVLYTRIFVNGTTGLSLISFKFDRLVVDGLVNLLGKIGVVLSTISGWLDTYVIDGLINAIASFAKTIGNFARHLQTGRLQHYLLTMVLVVLAVFVIKLFFPGI